MDNLTPAQTHLPCPDCGSTDALTINTDGSTKCYSCGIFKPNGKAPAVSKRPSGGVFEACNYQAITARKINEDTCRKFGYAVGIRRQQPCHIANYRNLSGDVIAQKFRFQDKSFTCEGKPTFFFGQHLWPNGGRKVVITEGEIDALTVSQVQDNKWPVVSLPSGAQSAKTVFKNNFEWLDSFDEVVLMFDEDDQGRKAAEEVCHLLPAGKTKIARLPMKDPNEMLLEGRGSEIVKAMWDAKPWKPDDIVDGVDLYERLTTPKNFTAIDYPFAGLNRLTHGIRKGEIVTFCAGSGIGKSHVCKVIAHDILKHSDHNVGYVALEESLERTANSIIGLEMGELLHLDPNFTPTDSYNEAFKVTVGSGRCFLYDHWGSLDSDNLISHIRYMTKVLDVDYLVLDHLSIVVSGMGDGDERRMIDNTMTKLRALVEETKLGLILVSHLKRPEGRGHEEGASTSLAQLRGSAGIAQLSDMVIGLERNQQDTEDRNKTVMRVLKNRFSGETGIACALNYNPETGSMSEEHYTENPF